jgi:hypothetical protein
MAHELNRRNASAHEMAARQAAHDHDWDAARRQWGLALMDVRLAGAGPADEALASYEYGRVLGITCDYARAEQMLQSSLKLARESGGPTHLALLELALLAEHQHQPRQALAYYRELVSEMDAHGVMQANPLGAAIVLRRYADLLAANGDATGAAQQRARADTVADVHPNGHAQGSLTPYGSACATAS